MTAQYSLKGILGGSERINRQGEDISRVNSILEGLLKRHLEWKSQDAALVLRNNTNSHGSRESALGLNRVDLIRYDNHVRISVQMSDGFNVQTFSLRDALPLRWIPLVYQCLPSILAWIGNCNEEVKADLDLIQQQANQA
jgi:hypothetical protein